MNSTARAVRPVLSPAVPMSTRLLELALGPLLWCQRQLVSRQLRQQPEAQGARSGQAGSGAVRLRVLVVGDAQAAGVAMADPESGLAPRLAHHLAALLSTDGPCTVTWQLLAGRQIGAQDMLGCMAATDLAPADVLVTLPGHHPTLHSVPTREWLRQMDALRSHARHRAQVRHVVHGSPMPPEPEPFGGLARPLRWQCLHAAQRLDRALRIHLRHSHRRTRFMLQPVGGGQAGQDLHPDARWIERWARQLAEHIEHDLAESVLQGAALPSGFQASDFWHPETASRF